MLHRIRQGLCLLREDLKNHNRVPIDPVDDSPRALAIHYAEFVAACTDSREWSRVRQAERLAALKPPQDESRLDPGLAAQRRSADLTMKPEQRFVARTHEQSMSDLTYSIKTARHVAHGIECGGGGFGVLEGALRSRTLRPSNLKWSEPGGLGSESRSDFELSGAGSNLEGETGAVNEVLQGEPDELRFTELKHAREARCAIRADGLAAALDVGQVRLGDPQQTGELGLGHLLALSLRDEQAGKRQGSDKFLEELRGVDALSTHAS